MKKFLFFFLLLMGTFVSQAYDFSAVAPTGQTLYYDISGTTVTVTSSPYSGYTTPTGNLTIPESISHNGIEYAVTSIGDNAFSFCSDLTRITIPNSVTTIGQYAFSYCSSLMSVTIPNSVTSIGGSAFYLVKHIVYNGSATGGPWGALTMNGFIEGDLIYEDATKIKVIGCNTTATSVVIPNSVTSIGNYAFLYCSNLASVTIPNSVISIGNEAFSYCSNLTSVTIPNSVTSIGSFAFSSCDELTSVIIGNSVTSIGSDAFKDCSSLTNVVFNATNCTNMDDPFSGGSVFSGCTNLTSITIGENVTCIPTSAFVGCNGITSITIPNSVTIIGSSAFYNCSGLTSVTISNSVTTIGNSAFYGCDGLTCMNYSGTIGEWCGITFGNYSANPLFYAHHLYIDGVLQTTIIIPDSITSIKDEIFIGCSSLTNITIPNSVTTIGKDAFAGCSNLTSITIPHSVTTIGNSAFFDCGSLMEITSLATTAPALGVDVFSVVNNQIPINIPCGSSMSYHSRWSYFSNFVEGSGFSLTTSSDDPVMGVVSVLTQPTCTNPQAVVYAAPSSGYQFDRWSNGVTANPYFFTLTQDTSLTAYFALQAKDTVYVTVHDTTYIDIHDTTYMPIHDTSYVDVFIHDTTVVTVYDTIIEQLTYYTLSVVSENNSRGLVAGNGTFPEGTEVEIAAIPIQGNVFVQWMDGNTENPRRVTANGNTSYVATFEANPVGVTEVKGVNFTIGTENGAIVVKDAPEMQVRIFDNLGRCLITNKGSELVRMFNMPTTGAYMVQVGNYPAQKVVVVK